MILCYTLEDTKPSHQNHLKQVHNIAFCENFSWSRALKWKEISFFNSFVHALIRVIDHDGIRGFFSVLSLTTEEPLKNA